MQLTPGRFFAGTARRYGQFRVHAARCTWLAGLLVLLLQRTPVLRVLVHAEFSVGARAGQIIRAMLPAAATFGAVHTLTGQSMMVINPDSPIAGTTGQPLAVGFAFTGGPVTPESYAIIGTLPPGLGVSGASGNPGNLTLNNNAGAIEGTPTTAGTYNVSVEAFDGPNRTAGTYGSSGPTFITFNIASGLSPPGFTTHPASRTVDAGAAATFTVVVTGSPTPTLEWRKDNTPIANQTGTSLTISAVALTDAGSYMCVATNSQGTATSNPATLTVTPPALPVISTQPIAMHSLVGSAGFFSVVATGSNLAYQWRQDGADLSGQTQSSLFLNNVSADDAGSYSVRVSNPGGFVDSNTVPFTVATTGRARLVNLSARAFVGTGDNVLIPGFVVGGSGTKTLLVRAVGPRLAQFGVTGFLADPTMQLFRGPVASEENDDWQLFPDQALLETTRSAVGAFALTPSTQPLKDASMVVSFQPGLNTIKTVGVGNTTGVALVELFDADPPTATSRLINISARAQVGTGGDVLIPGFFIEGDVSLTLLVRAVGPTLATQFNLPGALQDPVMTLVRITNTPNLGDQEVMTENDNWQQTPNLAAMVAAHSATGAFELDNGGADGALLVALNPGGYTVKVEGKGGTTGVALMEVYLVGP